MMKHYFVFLRSCLVASASQGFMASALLSPKKDIQIEVIFITKISFINSHNIELL